MIQQQSEKSFAITEPTTNYKEKKQRQFRRGKLREQRDFGFEVCLNESIRPTFIDQGLRVVTRLNNKKPSSHYGHNTH